jgi:methylmalonyl-CoA mutase C-terminal domain/subunit
MPKLKRVIIGKVGLDGHDRGALVVAEFLKNSGFEVIYTGLHKTADEIIRIAIQEDVSIIGISILSGSHKILIGDIINKARESGIDGLVVFAGGIIPVQDHAELTSMGVGKIFSPAGRLQDISDWLREVMSND